MKLKFRSNLQILTFLLITIFSNCVLATPFRDYLAELESRSGYTFSENTKTKLATYYKNNSHPIYGAALDSKHKNFIDNKEILIDDWEQYTGETWPRYTHNTKNRNYGDRYDAHHIIPQSHNGPNGWRNLIPLTSTQHHQVHKSGSKCSGLFPRSKGDRENKKYLP